MLPVTPSALAVIVVCPGVTPVTSPASEMLATAWTLEFQEIALPAIASPAAVLGVAVSWTV
jgi:hypothetical protein